MSKKQALKSAFIIYFKKQTQDAIQHTLSGLGISSLLIFGIHIIDFSKHGNGLAIVLTLVIGLIPVAVDFIFFYFRNLNRLEMKLTQLGNLARSVHKKNNELLKKSVLSRIDKEIEIVGKMHSNSLHLPALQNFEYIREILGRVLQRVMEAGDKYITLSRLDFWTTTPNEKNVNFIELNKNAVENSSKLIDRIIVLKKDMLNMPISPTHFSRSQFELLDLVGKFENTITHRFNYFTKIKTLFYFTDNYDNIKEFLLSALVIKKNYKDMMFIKVDRLKIEIENPDIHIKYFTFDNWHIASEAKNDTIKTIKSLIEYIENIINSNESQDDELSNLLSYLKFYRTCFGKLSTIYDIEGDGTRLSTIDISKCELFDIEMLLEYFNLGREQDSLRDRLN
jgi:hypothetical protein